MPTPFISTGNIGNVANKVSNVKYSNAGEQALVEQTGKTGQILVAGALEIYKKVEAADVMKANNEYNLKMNELKNKLLQNKEGNALENQKLYEEGRQKIIDDLMKRGPSTIKFGRGKDAFMTTIEKDWVNQKNWMDRYVVAESEKYQDTQLYNQLYNSVNEVTESFADDASVQSAINRGNAFIAARYFDYGEERIKAEQAKWQAKAYGTQISTALSVRDYQKAEQILKDHGDVLLPEVKIKLKNSIDERKKSDEQFNLFNELYQAGDLQAAIAHVQASDKYKTPTEKAKAEQELLNFFNFKKRQEQAIEDARFDNWQNQILAWKKENVPMEEAVKRAENWAGNDLELLEKARKAVKDGYYGLEGKGLQYGFEPVIYDMLREGKFSSKGMLDTFLRNNGATKEEYNRFMKSYEDRKAGRGIYSFPWNEIKKEVMADSGLKDAEFEKAWNEAQAAGRDFINQTMEKESRMPSVREVITKAKEGMIKTHYGTFDDGSFFFSKQDMEYSKGQLLRSGIKGIENNGGAYKVTFEDGSVLDVQGYELDRLINGEED